MDRAYQRVDVDAGGDPPVESDAGADTADEHAPPSQDLAEDDAISEDGGDQQDHAQVIAWIRHLQREGFYFQRKGATKDIVDGYRALVAAGTVAIFLLPDSEEIWENSQEDVADFFVADGGDEGPGQGTSQGRVFGA